MRDPSVTEQRRHKALGNLRKAEALYLRFLRTKEDHNNFKTLKVIGKGAFGEVKLVRRVSDNKVYALKSLIKTEMVSGFLIYSLLACCSQSVSTRKISWLMFGLSVTFLRSPTAPGLSSCTQPSKTTHICTC